MTAIIFLIAIIAMTSMYDGHKNYADHKNQNG